MYKCDKVAIVSDTEVDLKDICDLHFICKINYAPSHDAQK